MNWLKGAAQRRENSLPSAERLEDPPAEKARPGEEAARPEARRSGSLPPEDLSGACQPGPEKPLSPEEAESSLPQGEDRARPAAAKKPGASSLEASLEQAAAPISQSLESEFQNILHLFRGSFQSGLSPSDSNPQEEKTRDALIQRIVRENSSPGNQLRILSEFCSYGPLDQALRRPEITEIIVNGEDHIFYEVDGSMRRLSDRFLSNITFQNIIEKISAEARLAVNLKKPFAEGRWGDFRIHVIRPPLIQKDFHLSLRKHPKSVWTLSKLTKAGWAPEAAVNILRKFVHDKLNFLIAGPTSSGKTSALNACLQETEENERVITIEDADEITLPNAISLKLLTQTAPESQLAYVGQEELVRQSLRLRPDRIVMGEARGAEAKDLLLALASGHRGSIGTLHARDHRQALWKLETLIQMGAPQWQSETARKLIFSSLHGVAVLDRERGFRFLKGIYKISAYESAAGFLFESLFEKQA